MLKVYSYKLLNLIQNYYNFLLTVFILFNLSIRLN